MRILLDLNVVLDVLLGREPHLAASAGVFAAVERGRCAGLLPAHAFTTAWYLLRKAGGAHHANARLADLHALFGVAPVDEGVLLEALGLGWPDYEDAVTAVAARRAGCGMIVTRDPAGFPASAVPVLAPAAAAALLGA